MNARPSPRGRLDRSVRLVLRALLGAVVAVVTVGAIAGAAIVGAGRWWQPAAPASDLATATAHAPVAPDDTPARHVVDALVASDSWRAASTDARPPVRTISRESALDRCDDTPAAISAAYDVEVPGTGEVVVVAVEAVGAGLGQRALQDRVVAASRCGALVSLVDGPGIAAVEGIQSGRWWLAWRRGDVVVRITAGAAVVEQARAHSRELDGVLDRLLADVCLDTRAGADAAIRNPSQPDHRPYTVVEPVTAPTDVPAPDPALVLAPLPSPDAAAMRQAASLAGPPPPPELPVAGLVAVPAADTEGPGCGWAFTGMVGPSADQAAIEEAAGEARASATADLRSRWAAWPDDVAAWQRLRAAHLALQRERAARTTTTTTEPPPPDTTTTVAPTTSTTPRGGGRDKPTTTTTTTAPTATTVVTTPTAG